jgi:hypothetical protein
MPGPGEYLADVTEGITRVEDLPRARILTRSRNSKRYPCPRCGTSASRVRRVQRHLHDVGDLVAGRPQELRLTDSQHYGPCWSQYFNAAMSDVAPPGSHYPHRVVALAVRRVVEDGLPYRAVSWPLWRDHRVFFPFATLQKWVEAGGKKG